MPDLHESVARISHATVRAYGRPAALLDDVSMHVGLGERMLVIGPSGSGKSTLLKALTGVIPFSENLATDARVHLGGVEVTELSVRERSRLLGVVAQDPSASVCLARVEDEVALPLENHAVARTEISARIDAALAKADAGELRDRATDGLSGGEVQRVALAAALASQPDMLLLDEPTSMLDPAGVRAVRSAINNAAADAHAAVLLVEHRLDELAGAEGARGLPERVIILDDAGRMVACGQTQSVLAEHAAQLHDAGCWLPLETELLAVTGNSGGLCSEPVQTWLRERASGAGQSEGHGAALLSARSLSVGHRSVSPRTSSGRNRLVDEAILANVNLAVHAGEVVALLGANGTGKSSLLLTLAGLLPALGGAVVGPRPSMVFQQPELQFLAHRVRDEIATGLAGNAAETAEIVERQLRQHRLEHVADSDPYRLSGGEKRRLSLAAMLAHVDRPVLLADEPAFGLDRRDTVALAGVFRDEAAYGRSILFSSHDLRFVAAVADRVVVLANGDVVADGPTAAVLQEDEVLRCAGLEVPPVVGWLLAECDAEGVSHALRHLYDAAAHPQAHISAPSPSERHGSLPAQRVVAIR